MAQHDYIIDNAPGLAVRQDINAVLQAIVTQNSGPVEPVAKFPGQLWLDTSVAEGQLRQRNLANSAWISPSIRDFSMPISITGNDANGRLRFTGLQTDSSAVSLNPLGIEFVSPDLFFGVRRYHSDAAPNRFVWNADADGNGLDLMTLWENGPLTLGGGSYTSGIIQTPQPGTVFFRRRNAAAGRWYWNITDTGLIGGANDVSVASLDDAGVFTTLGTISGNGVFGGRAANINLRPAGPTNPFNESIFYSNGQVNVPGNIFAGGVPAALVGPATAVDTIVFPIGTVLLAGSGTNLNRQTVYGVYLEASGAGAWYICNTTPTGWVAGSQLQGIWVCRSCCPASVAPPATGIIYLCTVQKIG